MRWKIKGKENRPELGSLVIMANHVSFLDPPVVGCIMNRPVHFMAKEDLFKIPVISWFIKKMGAFPIKRGKPDRKALRKSLAVLKNEEILGLFPEGTRYKQGKPGKARSGAVVIPIRMKAPILPVGIKYKGLRLYISIGQPFELKGFYNRKLTRNDVKQAGDIIMKKIKDELSAI